MLPTKCAVGGRVSSVGGSVLRKYQRVPTMRAFIDFEASSLGRRGYPIEVAWVFEDGNSETFLIAPIDEWTDWDPAAEAIHGISRAQLSREGVSTDIVARRLVDALQGFKVFASAPSWDGKWLSALLRSAGLPRHAIRVFDTDAALMELAAALLAPVLSSKEIHRATRKILADAASHFGDRQPSHRALPDAQFERERWFMVSDLAHSYGRRTAVARGQLVNDSSESPGSVLHQRHVAAIHLRHQHSTHFQGEQE